MESTNSTLAGTSCPTTNHEHRNGTDRSNDNVTDQLSVANPRPAKTEENVLAETLNQLLHHAAPTAQDSSMPPADNTGPLIDSNLSLLATLASVSAASRDRLSRASKPGGCQRAENNVGQSLDPTSSQSIQNLSQLAGSAANQSSLGVSPTKTGSLSGGGEFHGSIMEEIDPPTVLPDLNMAMAEGLAASASVSGTEQQTSRKGGHKPATKEKGIPAVTAIHSAAGQPAKAAPAQTSSAVFHVKESKSTVSSAVSQPGNLTTSRMQPNSVSTRQSTSSHVAPPIPQSTISSATAPKHAVQAPQTVTSGGATPSQFPPPCAVTPITHPSSSTSTTTSLPASLPMVASSATTSQAASSSSKSASVLAKGLNLPLLQFLNLNFPSLKIKDLQDVLSINTLLTQVLKQQLNNPASAAVTAQQLADASKVGQLTLKTAIPSSTSLTTVQSSSGIGKVSGAQLSKLGVSSVTSSGVSGPSRLGLPRPVTVPSVSSSPKSSSSLTPIAAAAQLKLTAEGKAGDPKAQLASSGLGINVDLLSKQSSSLLSSLASSPSSNSAGAGNRKAVLVQILNKTGSSTPTTVTTTPPSKDPILIPRMVKPLYKSPLILNRHSRPQQQQQQQHSPSISTSTSTTTTVSSGSRSSTPASSKSSPPVSSLCVSLSLPALKGAIQPKDPAEKKRKTPTRKSTHQSTPDTSQQQLNRTVVQPAESEAMEVDVGQPVQKMKLPKHLRDHSYSLYNPEEAEKQRVLSASNFSFISTIPPARLSYAPQVPDSPSTLHKLLKVLPKKNSRQAHSPPRSGRGFGRRNRGSRKGRNQGKNRGKGSAKKMGLTPTLTTVSEPSSSDQSDSEELSGKVRIVLHVLCIVCRVQPICHQFTCNVLCINT